MAAITLSDAEESALRVMLVTGNKTGPISIVISALCERLGDEIKPGDGQKVKREAAKIQTKRRMEIYGPWQDLGGE